MMTESPLPVPSPRANPVAFRTRSCFDPHAD
jgi:hypothetical protein